MVQGEYLSADDLGPLGRLVAPGELLVLDPGDASKVSAEREWVGRRYRGADRRAERLRQRLSTARMSGKRDKVRESFEDWTLEAAKLALCDQYLLKVNGQLDRGSQQAINLKKTFRLQTLPRVTALTERLASASDEEIVGGGVFRAS